MKTNVLIASAIFYLFTISATSQEKQDRFGFELTGGASFATNKFVNEKLKPGFGFEGLLHYRFLSHTSAYAGWGYNNFKGKESLDVDETGYIFGLQQNFDLRNTPLSLYVRAGGLYNHTELENSDGDIISDSGHGLGYQLAGGIEIPLNEKWVLTPGIKFNSLSRDIDIENISKAFDLRYMSVRVGIIKRF